ncbi:hypothetical protein GOBAR_AA13181 [Gossypium barbadense]|uniref:Purple acid phosphatase C-terminal domain-containing protein n=1 Tax=Gossypium barbadense TaxID=3634 RepID=A0A2P5XVW0_GOSBA|nr:hypothetical protein GOBAR_AA13181 [Gossypium barbadense]
MIHKLKSRGNYRSTIGRIFFKTNDIVQAVEAPDSVRNKVSFSVFGFLDREVSLKESLDSSIFEPPESFILNSFMHNLLSIVSISVQSLVYFMEGRLMLLSSEFSCSNLKYKVQLSSGERYPISDKSTPVHITDGDGGNQEGLAGRFLDPQPEYSTF